MSYRQPEIFGPRRTRTPRVTRWAVAALAPTSSRSVTPSLNDGQPRAVRLSETLWIVAASDIFGGGSCFEMDVRSSVSGFIAECIVTQTFLCGREFPPRSIPRQEMRS